MEVLFDKGVGIYKILKECGLWNIIEDNMEVIMGHNRGNSNEFGVGHHHLTVKKDRIFLIIVNIVTRLYIELTTLLRKPFEK